MKVLKCAIGETSFGFELKREIEEVIEAVEVRQFPGQKKQTVGFFNYRGREIQLLDLAHILKWKYSNEYVNRFIIVIKDKSFAFLVDHIDNIYDLPDEQMEDPSDHKLPNGEMIAKVYVEGSYPIYEISKILEKIKDGRKKHSKSKSA